jgi:hypothetical protein
MTLANDPGGFSAGEIYALFNPYRSHHVNPLCGCGDPTCQIWPMVLANGPQRLYETLFDLNPEADFIVDSSKDPFWIRRQQELLASSGIETKNIVIWKTPLELASSFKKRGQLSRWGPNWVNYFRLYHTLVDEWRSIPYADYTNDPAVLESICHHLGIPYFAGKEEFWRKEHHLLFGNESALVHLQGTSDQPDEREQDHGLVQDDATQDLRTVYYNTVDDPELERLVAQWSDNSPYLQGLVNLLGDRDVRNDGIITAEYPELKMSTSEVQLRRLRQSLHRRIGRFRYARQDNKAG